MTQDDRLTARPSAVRPGGRQWRGLSRPGTRRKELAPRCTTKLRCRSGRGAGRYAAGRRHARRRGCYRGLLVGPRRVSRTIPANGVRPHPHPARRSCRQKFNTSISVRYCMKPVMFEERPMSERKQASPSEGEPSPLTDRDAVCMRWVKSACLVARGPGGRSHDAEGATIVKITCLACGRCWYDVYRLAAVMPGGGGLNPSCGTKMDFTQAYWCDILIAVRTPPAWRRTPGADPSEN
jgi:hypothetical protein